MKFDETPRFWYPRVALDAWMKFASRSDEIQLSDFCRFEKETKIRKNKNISPLRSLPLSVFTFLFGFFGFYLLLLLLLLLLLFWIHSLYCFIRVRFCPETIYLFSIHFILNELSSSHFPTSEIFIKISSLKLLTTYHPENLKIFRLSQNSTKLF